MSSSDFEHIRIERHGAAALITLSRPAALNALSAELLVELEQALQLAAAMEGVRGIILTGDGPKAFAAGADISRMPEMSTDDAHAFSARGNRLFRTIETLDLPVIAAVNGFALGGGCELAMACDFIYAAENARFGQPEVNLGIIAGFGGTQRLARRVGSAMAIELLTTGRMIDAQEALRIGLVNRVLPREELVEAAVATVGEIAAKAPQAVAASKRLAHLAGDVSIEDGLAAETDAFAECFGSSDAREGIGAFLEKRKPTFTGH